MKSLIFGLLATVSISSSLVFVPFTKAESQPIQVNTVYGDLTGGEWLLQDGTQPIPSCEWLKSNGVIGIDSTVDYEITTAELCDEDGGRQ